MDGDYREPDQDTEVMHGEEWASLRRASHHESDSTADHHEGRDEEQRGQHPQWQAGRAAAHEGGRSGVVAQEPVEGRAELDREGTDQKHPDKDVDRQQRAQARRAHELNQDQHEEHRTGQRSQPFVANYPGPTLTVLYVHAGRSRCTHGLIVAERFHSPPHWCLIPFHAVFRPFLIAGEAKGKFIFQGLDDRSRISRRPNSSHVASPGECLCRTASCADPTLG
ncbi:MAG: hypothetical protein ACJ8BW_16510 [Ktedonobacteraceae bacterium]